MHVCWFLSLRETVAIGSSVTYCHTNRLQTVGAAACNVREHLRPKDILQVLWQR